MPAIYRIGDKVSFTGTGHPVTGVIEAFSNPGLDVRSIITGRDGDTAHVRADSGDLIPVPVAELSAASS
jgi:hypothetical protein